MEKICKINKKILSCIESLKEYWQVKGRVGRLDGVKVGESLWDFILFQFDIRKRELNG